MIDVKSDKDYESMLETFMEGQCHTFAEALVELFGYRLGAITTEVDGEFCLVHAFAVDGEFVIDFKGRRDVTDVITEFMFLNSLSNEQIDKRINLTMSEWNHIISSSEAYVDPEALELAQQWINKYRNFYSP